MVTGSEPGPVRVKGRHQTTHGIHEGFLGQKCLEEQRESSDTGRQWGVATVKRERFLLE